MSAASHGQRFRRRAIRRGYKVDEVDSFLDRVEATLNGAPLPGGPVSAQEVHDVIFRVRFGGYDEWQVDLHLDRVERQLAELEERSAPPGVGAQLRAAMSGGAPDRLGPPPPPLPTRTPAANAPTSTLPRYDQQRFEEPSYATTATGNLPPIGGNGFDNFDPSRHGRSEMTGEIRLDRRIPQAPEPPRMEPPRMDPYATGGYGVPSQSMSQTMGGGMSQTMGGGMGQTMGGGMGGMSAFREPVMAQPYGGDAQRVDQLRRTFQLRRFGSGYDPVQVDRIFENVMAALSGRGGVNDSELDPSRLALVPGGYYEAEVEQAMREVRGLLQR